MGQRDPPPKGNELILSQTWGPKKKLHFLFATLNHAFYNLQLFIETQMGPSLALPWLQSVLQVHGD